MSANNKKLERISLYDMVEDLVHDGSNITKIKIMHLESCLHMVFDNLDAAQACYNAYARRKGFDIQKEQYVKTKRFNANFENKLQNGSRDSKSLYKKDVYEMSRRRQGHSQRRIQASWTQLYEKFIRSF
ncbi:hypothetical protein CFP56_013577 [Quercus suber]|uniref:Uncharacterized protein n=1 Tax=Quercus suber TaxID=58331 RepID=A0AAW0KV45_QUESU